LAAFFIAAQDRLLIVGWFTTSKGRIVALSISRCSRDLSPRRFLPNLHPVQGGGVFFVVNVPCALTHLAETNAAATAQGRQGLQG